ncbi:MAG TPA: FAD-dependent oxidoreductase [Solirubrobacteraceae bacterium]|nr:FAD-dependent oxidoreductase [Solirubrobacteraceae bacterium]
MTSTDNDNPAPIRVAVVGAGPAGFYAAGHLLKDSAGRIEVDMLERLPTPWGLVRSGVAPDHPKIKSVTRIYEKTAEHPRFRYFGNVELGRQVSREELLAHYHAVVYATGAPSDRPLGIPGEDLPGSWPATEFVGWYNGHPDHPDLDFDLGCERAVVIGNGNVALDVARMLVLSQDELAGTDTADHALQALAQSAVREVVVAGRRGPAQAAFTNPELRELGELTDADVVVDGDELERALAVADPNAGVTAKKNVEILRDYATREPREGRRRIVLRFLLSPVEVLAGDDGRAAGVRLVRNELVAEPDGGLRARATGQSETIPAGLVLRAIGYRGLALPGVPFDERAATIRNAGGRVLGEDDRPLPGEYTVGWIKRGPTGIIGTNKKDAQQTVDAIFEDLAGGRLHEPPAPDPTELQETLRARQPDLVSYAAWSEIDRHERERGESEGRPRVKLTRIEEMLRVAADELPTG